MGRFQGIKVVGNTLHIITATHLPTQHVWAYYQDRQVDPWQGAICGASAGKLHHRQVHYSHLVF